MHQKPLGGRAPPDLLGELKRSPRPPSRSYGVGPPGGGGEREGGEGGEGEGREGKGRGREEREEGTRRGPQFKKNDPRHQMAGYGPEVAICAKFTDGRTDGRRTPRDCISSWNELKITAQRMQSAYGVV